MNELFQKLLHAKQVREITSIIEEVQENATVSWTPVGGRQNNISTINIGTDPAAGLTERITNAIDAVLEKEYTTRGEPEEITSPRTAVKEWFDIKDGKLSNIDARDKKIETLKESIKITLFDSEKESNPTVDIRDHGIGIRPEDFKNTILSLNESNKIRKLHLLGAYGQGGSTALSYNLYTLIISKPYIRAKGDKPAIAWTIVRCNEGDVNKDKNPWYEYMVNGANGQPFVIQVSDEDFEPGTLIRHVHMDIGKYKAAMTNLTGSLWYLSHHYLFDTIVPFTISDERERKTKGKIENRTVLGNNRRLTQGENTEYQNKAELTFRDGKVNIYWWVLSREGTQNPKERITQYTLASQPIIITFNGQKQGTLPNTIIKTDLKLPFLERYIIVQVECDHLDNESKRQLFSSTRESTRDTTVLEELRQVVTDTLAEDDELRRLDKARKEFYLKVEDNEIHDKLRRRLANRINVFLKGEHGGKVVQVSDTREGQNRKKLPPVPVVDPPTFIEITSPAPREVYAGKTFSIKFKTDAHPNYFYNPDTFIAVIAPHSFGSYTGSTRVIDGYGIAYFKVNEEVDIGTESSITLEVRPPRERTISDSITAQVVPLPDNADPTNSGKGNIPDINPIWIGEDDELFKDDKWDTNSVAKVEETTESITIFVSEVNKNLTKLIARAQRKSVDAVTSIKNRYLEHISFYAYLSHRQRTEREKSEEYKSIESETLDILKNDDLQCTSETLCGIIDDFFESIVIEAQALEE